MPTMGWARGIPAADPYAPALPKFHTSPCTLASQKLVERRPLEEVSKAVGAPASAVEAAVPASAAAAEATPRQPRPARPATSTAPRARRRRNRTTTSASPRRRDEAAGPRRLLHPKCRTATPRRFSRSRHDTGLRNANAPLLRPLWDRSRRTGCDGKLPIDPRNQGAIRLRLMVLPPLSRSAGECVEGRLVEDELAGDQVFIQVLQ